MFQSRTDMVGNPLLNLAVFFLGVFILVVVFHPAFRLRNRLLSKASRNKILREDILKFLFHRELDQKNTNVEEAKNAMQKNMKAVFHQIEAMEDDGLLLSENGQITLTEDGRNYATRLIRSHRLVEKHLALNTGFHKKEWHDIAEKREHDFDDDATAQLSQSLGHPLFDPHGDPIPDIDGTVIKTEGTPLAEFQIQVPAQVLHLEDEPKFIYEQILQKRIHLGSELIIKEKSSNNVTFFCEGNVVTLPNLIANNITVGPLPAGTTIDETVFRLSKLEEGEDAVIVGISSESIGTRRRRLLDLGFVKGSVIRIAMRSPFGQPIAYVVRGASIALRTEQAEMILVKPIPVNHE